MKRLIIYLCVICIAFSFSISISSANEKPSTKTIEINYYPLSKFFGDYDVCVYLDNKRIEIVQCREVLQKDFKLVAGTHKIKFEKKKNSSVSITKRFKVTKNQHYYIFALFTPSRKIIKAYRTKTDLNILTMDDHPKVLDSIDTAEKSWRKYANMKIGIFNPDANTSYDPLIEGNYIASVETSYYRWIHDIQFNVYNIDGIEKIVYDADSAVKFLGNFVNKDKLKRYYNSGQSYRVKTEGNDLLTGYVINYHVNEAGKAKNYPENLWAEIDKEGENITYLRLWWRGRPGSVWGSNYHTYYKWEKRL